MRPKKLSRETASVSKTLKIAGTVIDVDCANTYLSVRYRSVDGRRRSALLDRALFQDPHKVVRELLRLGAELPDDSGEAARIVVEALRRRPAKVLKKTARAGWHGSTFVYPTRSFGKQADTLSFAEDRGPIATLGTLRGSLRAWRDGLADAIGHSDYLLFAASVPPASSLLSVIGEQEGAFFHFHGAKFGTSHKSKSSSGKSTAARVAASEFGRARKNDIATFALSDRALEDFCCAHSGIGAVLDELGRATQSSSNVRMPPDRFAYIVASGRGAIRSTKATQDPHLANRTWCLYGISTGEEPLEDVTTRTEGAELRMIGVPVPPGHSGGIFNRLSGDDAATAAKRAELMIEIDNTIDKNFGHVIPAFVQRVVADRKLVRRRVKAIIRKFVRKQGADRDPWESRFAAKFGLVLAAATLLAEFGIGPWSTRAAAKAIRLIYTKSRSQIISIDAAAAQFTERLRNCQKQVFPRIERGRTLTHSDRSRAIGFRRRVGKHGDCIFIPMARARELVVPSAASRRVFEHLVQRRIIIPAQDGNLCRQVLVRGLSKKRKRFLCISRKGLKHQIAAAN